jgi:hypothetical protein
VQRTIRWFSALLIAAVLVVPALPAQARHRQDPRTNNLRPRGHIIEPRSLINPEIGNPNIHTDIAFWGEFAFQGAWLGFNVRDISSPSNPKQVSFTSCTGDQGDVVVWEDVLVRSWNSPAEEGATCDGEPVPVGFEGLHVFDISDKRDPELIGAVELSGQSEPVGCGSHTATGVPDPARDRLLVYNSSSSEDCPWIDIVQISLNGSGQASVLRQEHARRQCHDTGVILGDARLAACAGGNGFTVWSLGGDRGGSLVNPRLLYSRPVPGVTIGHSAVFTWDGEVLIFGHEPGGGVEAECEARDVPRNKSAFFFDASDGDLLGRWTLPRPQSARENCSVHNYNVVPLRTGRYILVSGNYQAGTWVTDFTEPGDAKALAWSDPRPLPVPEGSPFCAPAGCELGGVWSSYWYNDLIYETNITEGLNIFEFTGRRTAGAIHLGHLNPQTQEFTLP